MNKLKNISKKLVIFLVIFSFLAGIFPLNFNTETVYAKKNKAKEACYVIIADDYDTFKDLGVTDGSKAKIAVLSTSMVFTTTPPFDSTDKAQKIFKNLSKASHAEVIYIPSSKEWTNSKKQKTNDSAIKFGYDKGKTARNIMKKFSDVSKKDKFVTKFQPFTGNNGNAYLMTGYIGKMNLGLSYYMAGKDEKGDETKKNKEVGAKLIESPSAINSDKSAQAEMLVTLLKNAKSNAFAYLTADSTKKDSSGDLLSDGSTSTDGSGETSTDGTASFKNTEDLLQKLGVDDDKKDDLEKYAQYLIGVGYSEAATAGLLANMRTESEFNPLAYENDENGGLFGFTPMTKFSNSKFNKECTHTKGTACGQSVCSDGECQVLYVLDFLKSAIDSNAGRIHNANKFFSNATEETKKADYYTKWAKNVKFPDKIDEVKNLDEYKKLEDPISAAAIFSICYEVCAGTYEPCNLTLTDGTKNYHSVHPSKDSVKKSWHDFTLHEFNVNEGRLSYAKPIYEWLTGSEFKNSNTDNAAKMAEEAQKKGYLTEEELSSWTKIINEKFINYKDITRNNLNQSELSSLSRWEQNVKYDDLENHGVFHVFRWLFMAMAILMMIWSVLLYCAYWMDKVNPFCLPFSFVSFLTLGKLETAPTEGECNFTTRGLFKEKDTKSKFINHKYMLFVCLSLIFFSVLILTGTLYKIILTVIGFVAGIFGF